jgi:hypothetical protein
MAWYCCVPCCRVSFREGPKKTYDRGLYQLPERKPLTCVSCAASRLYCRRYNTRGGVSIFFHPRTWIEAPLSSSTSQRLKSESRRDGTSLVNWNSQQLPKSRSAFHRDAHHTRIPHRNHPAHFLKPFIHRAPQRACDVVSPLGPVQAAPR